MKRPDIDRMECFRKNLADQEANTEALIAVVMVLNSVVETIKERDTKQLDVALKMINATWTKEPKQ